MLFRASPTAESKGVGMMLPHQESYGENDTSFSANVPPVWCLDCYENLIVLGTGSGRLEIWDGFKGVLKVIFKKFMHGAIIRIKLIHN